MQGLSKYCKSEIASLMEDTGHVLTLEDYSDIVELDKLCMIVNGEWEEHNKIFDFPIDVGGVKLRQPVLGAVEWYEEVCCPAMRDDVEMIDIALAMIMTDPGNKHEYWEISDPREIWKAVKRFKRTLKCTHDELREAIAENMGVKVSDIWITADGDKPEETDEDRAKREEKGKESTSSILVCVLTKEYGNSPSYWMWEAPIGIVNTMYSALVCRIEAEREDVRRQCKGNDKPPPAESVLLKFEAMRDKIKAMREKWQTK